MARLNFCSLLLPVFALSKLVTASPLLLHRQFGPVANGTVISGCNEFHIVVAGETCQTIETNFGITDGLFHALNPEVNSGCTNLIVGEAYCVQATSSNAPVAPGTIVAGCTEFHTVVFGDTCIVLESEFDTTFDALRTLNPSIDANCDNLIIGEAYCVQTSTSSTGPPNNVAPGTLTDGCTLFFTVQPGQSCTTVEDMFNITAGRFVSLNPEIDAACDDLIAGLAYCVDSD